MAGEPQIDKLCRLAYEQAILMELVFYQDQADKIFELLPVEDFYATKHQIIFRTAKNLRNVGEPFDSVSTYYAIRDAGDLEKAGGPAYLPSLDVSCPRPSNVEHYCRVISGFARKRRIWAAGHRIMQQALKPEKSDEETFEYAQSVIAEVGVSRHGSQETRRQFSLQHIGSIKITVPDFVAHGLIETDSLVTLFGSAESCKSLFMIGLSACVATGTAFYGVPVKQGAVVYIAGEGQNGIQRRFTAWSIVNQIPLGNAPIYISTQPISLCDDVSIEHVLETIKDVGEQSGPPPLVVIDTVARNFGPGDENSTVDMTKAIAGADRIRELCRSAVVLVHHSGVMDKNRGRGNSALRGAVDAEYRMEKDGFGVIHFEATKMKDAGYPEPMAFKIAVVELGLEDAEGNEITSVVLRQVDDGPPVQNQNCSLGKNQALGIHILMELYQTHRENVEKSGRDPESARVLVEDWSAACKNEGMKRQAFYKMKAAMIEKGMVRVDEPFVYPSPL